MFVGLGRNSGESVINPSINENIQQSRCDRVLRICHEYFEALQRMFTKLSESLSTFCHRFHDAGKAFRNDCLDKLHRLREFFFGPRNNETTEYPPSSIIPASTLSSRPIAPNRALPPTPNRVSSSNQIKEQILIKQLTDKLSGDVSVKQGVSDRITHYMSEISDISEKEKIVNLMTEIISNNTIDDDYEIANILKALIAISPGERENVLAHATRFHNLTGHNLTSRVLEIFARVPLEERDAYMVEALKVTEHLSFGAVDVLETLADIRQEDRKEVVSHIITLLGKKPVSYDDVRERTESGELIVSRIRKIQNTSHDRSYVSALLKAVANTTAEKRTEENIESIAYVIEKMQRHYDSYSNSLSGNALILTKPLIEGLKEDGRVIARVVHTVALLQPNPEAIIARASPLIKHLRCGDTLAEMLRAVADCHAVNEEMWSVIIGHALPAMEGLGDWGKPALLRTIANLVPSCPDDDIHELLTQARAFMVGAKGYHINEVLKALQEIPSSQRPLLLTQAAQISIGIKEGYERVAILKSLMSIEVGKRPAVILQSASLLQEATFGSSIAKILKAIAKIPENKRDAVLEQVKPFMAEITNDYYWPSFIKAFGKIDPSDWKEVIELSQRPLFFDSVCCSIVDVLLSIAAIPKEQNRAKVIDQASPILLRVTKVYERAAILKIFAKLPQEERPPFIACLLNATRAMSDGRNIRKVAEVLAGIPATERQGAIDILNQKSFRPPDFYSSNDYEKAIYMENIRDVIALVTPEHRQKAYDKMKESEISRSRQRAILKNLFADEAVRSTSYAHISKFLAEVKSPDLQNQFIKLVLEYQWALQIEQTMPLFQELIAAMSLCDPKALDDIKNPYRVYQFLKKELNTGEMVAVEITPQTIENKSVMWNLPVLREKGRWEGYTVSDIAAWSQGINERSLQEAFTAMEQRLQRLPLEERNEITNNIKKAAGISEGGDFDSIYTTLLTSPFVKHWIVEGKKSKGSPLSPTAFHLHAAIKAIQDADGSTPIKSPFVRGARITAREELLLKLAIEVKACDIGQKDGLAIFYNKLPSQYKKGIAAQEDAQTGKTTTFIENEIQSFLKDTFDDDALQREITGVTGPLQQTSHLMTHFINRYHQQVGLKDQLTFDSHTGVLYDGVFSTSRAAFLKAYFQHGTPMKMVERLVDSSTLFFREKQPYSSIVNTLEEHLYQDLSSIGAISKYIVLDKDLTPLTLTKEGAVQLLLATGYLTQV